MLKRINEWEVLTPDGWSDFGGISTMPISQVCKLELSDGEIVYATKDHIFYDQGEKIEVKDLLQGMVLDGIGSDLPRTIKSIKLDVEERIVYDLIEVPKSHKFILNNKLYTKNCDEFAFIDQTMMEKFWPSNFPTVAANKGQIIIVSTPNGASGKFYELYSDAINETNTKSSFKAITIPWHRHPDKDEEWKKEMLTSMSEVQFRQEFECSFAGSTYTLINGDTLSALKKLNPLEVRDDGKYQIWEKPHKGRVYAFGIDSAAGNGNDYSVICIYDITQFITKGKYRQVGLYRCNDTNIFDFSNIVHRLAFEWNEAVIILENNESGLGNILGMQLYNEKAYERIYFDYKLSRVGVNSNTQTKKLATTYFKQDLEGNYVEIASSIVIDELLIYEEKENQPGVFAAKRGRNYHDDTVVGSFWVSYLLRTEWFDSMKESIYAKALQMTDPKLKGAQLEQQRLLELQQENEKYDYDLSEAFLRKSKMRRNSINSFDAEMWED